MEIVDGKPHKRSQGRTDYTLRIKVTSAAQPVAEALIEAKGAINSAIDKHNRGGIFIAWMVITIS